MNRRGFLRNAGFLSVSMALGALAGCGSSDTDSVAPPPAAATGTGWKFPQSVASGDPVADGAILWTRVVAASADDVLTAASATDFCVRLIVTAADNSALLGGNTPLSGALVVDNSVPVLARFDGTVRNRVAGLQPATTYYYQFIAGEVRSRVGRFRTAPAREADLAQLRLALLSCQDWTVNHWAGFEELAREELDLIVHVGDYIYETVGEDFQSGAVESRHTALVLPDGTAKTDNKNARYATTLADYRYLYKRYRTDPRLQAVHERFAFVATWDDHEFSDDCWQDAETYDNGSFDAATGAADNTHQKDRRRRANQAWYEYMPANIQFDEAGSSYDNVRIYRDLPYGKLAHFVVTDERLYRADHIIPEAVPNPATGAALGSTGSRYFVPQASLSGAEAQKIAAAQKAGLADTLAPVSMLGTTQRNWWKQTLAASTSTWKLWCNEVSLLRMGLNGTDAIATLLALQSIPTLTSQINGVTANSNGNVAVAAAIVAAVSAGATQNIAGAAAMAIASATSNPQGAAVSAGLTTAQAGIAVMAYQAASAAPAGTQASAAAQVIAFGYVKPDIQTNGAKSSFVIASGQAAALAPYFNRFLLNCDQWDGYNAERKDLLAHLKSKNIANVVGLTGDLHAFFAGTVNDDFDSAGNGTPVMVDLVGAGMSSDSFFSYFSSATTGSALSTLVFYPLSIPVSGVGTVTLNFNLFDYTLARSAPTLDQLAEQARRPLRAALAAKGVPEASLDTTTSAVLSGLKATPAFAQDLLALAGQLAGLKSNPWIKHVSTDAQGYSLITVTPDKLVCQFKTVNKLVGTAAPSSTVIANVTTATITRGTAAVLIS